MICSMCGDKYQSIHNCTPEKQQDAIRPTLRDEFAMAALGKLSMALPSTPDNWSLQEKEKANVIAEAAYLLADAMLAARSSTGQ